MENIRVHKTNGLKYSILQLIARDFLAILIPIVGSEFIRINGRFLIPHHNRLHSNILEGLMYLLALD